jgi:hypothetical protein
MSQTTRNAHTAIPPGVPDDVQACTLCLLHERHSIEEEIPFYPEHHPLSDVYGQTSWAAMATYDHMGAPVVFKPTLSVIHEGLLSHEGTVPCPVITWGPVTGTQGFRLKTSIALIWTVMTPDGETFVAQTIASSMPLVVRGAAPRLAIPTIVGSIPGVLTLTVSLQTLEGEREFPPIAVSRPGLDVPAPAIAANIGAMMNIEVSPMGGFALTEPVKPRPVVKIQAAAHPAAQAGGDARAGPAEEPVQEAAPGPLAHPDPAQEPDTPESGPEFGPHQLPPELTQRVLIASHTQTMFLTKPSGGLSAGYHYYDASLLPEGAAQLGDTYNFVALKRTRTARAIYSLGNHGGVLNYFPPVGRGEFLPGRGVAVQRLHNPPTITVDMAGTQLTGKAYKVQVAPGGKYSVKAAPTILLIVPDSGSTPVITWVMSGAGEPQLAGTPYKVVRDLSPADTVFYRLPADVPEEIQPEALGCIPLITTLTLAGKKKRNPVEDMVMAYALARSPGESYPLPHLPSAEGQLQSRGYIRANSFRECLDPTSLTLRKAFIQGSSMEGIPLFLFAVEGSLTLVCGTTGSVGTEDINDFLGSVRAPLIGSVTTHKRIHVRPLVRSEPPQQTEVGLGAPAAGRKARRGKKVPIMRFDWRDMGAPVASRAAAEAARCNIFARHVHHRVLRSILSDRHPQGVPQDARPLRHYLIGAGFLDNLTALEGVNAEAAGVINSKTPDYVYVHTSSDESTIVHISDLTRGHVAGQREDGSVILRQSSKVSYFLGIASALRCLETAREGLEVRFELLQSTKYTMVDEEKVAQSHTYVRPGMRRIVVMMNSWEYVLSDESLEVYATPHSIVGNTVRHGTPVLVTVRPLTELGGRGAFLYSDPANYPLPEGVERSDFWGAFGAIETSPGTSSLRGRLHRAAESLQVASQYTNGVHVYVTVDAPLEHGLLNPYITADVVDTAHPCKLLGDERLRKLAVVPEKAMARLLRGERVQGAQIRLEYAPKRGYPPTHNRQVHGDAILVQWAENLSCIAPVAGVYCCPEPIESVVEKSVWAQIALNDDPDFVGGTSKLAGQPAPRRRLCKVLQDEVTRHNEQLRAGDIRERPKTLQDRTPGSAHGPKKSFLCGVLGPSENPWEGEEENFYMSTLKKFHHLLDGEEGVAGEVAEMIRVITRFDETGALPCYGVRDGGCSVMVDGQRCGFKLNPDGDCRVCQTRPQIRQQVTGKHHNQTEAKATKGTKPGDFGLFRVPISCTRSGLPATLRSMGVGAKEDAQVEFSESAVRATAKEEVERRARRVLDLGFGEDRDGLLRMARGNLEETLEQSIKSASDVTELERLSRSTARQLGSAEKRVRAGLMRTFMDGAEAESAAQVCLEVERDSAFFRGCLASLCEAEPHGGVYHPGSFTVDGVPDLPGLKEKIGMSPEVINGGLEDAEQVIKSFIGTRGGRRISALAHLGSSICRLAKGKNKAYTLIPTPDTSLFAVVIPGADAPPVMLITIEDDSPMRSDLSGGRPHLVKPIEINGKKCYLVVDNPVRFHIDVWGHIATQDHMYCSLAGEVAMQEGLTTGIQHAHKVQLLLMAPHDLAKAMEFIIFICMATLASEKYGKEPVVGIKNYIGAGLMAEILKTVEAEVELHKIESSDTDSMDSGDKEGVESSRVLRPRMMTGGIHYRGVAAFEAYIGKFLPAAMVEQGAAIPGSYNKLLHQDIQALAGARGTNPTYQYGFSQAHVEDALRANAVYNTKRKRSHCPYMSMTAMHIYGKKFALSPTQVAKIEERILSDMNAPVIRVANSNASTPQPSPDDLEFIGPCVHRMDEVLEEAGPISGTKGAQLMKVIQSASGVVPTIGASVADLCEQIGKKARAQDLEGLRKLVVSVGVSKLCPKVEEQGTGKRLFSVWTLVASLASRSKEEASRVLTSFSKDSKNFISLTPDERVREMIRMRKEAGEVARGIYTKAKKGGYLEEYEDLCRNLTTYLGFDPIELVTGGEGQFKDFLEEGAAVGANCDSSAFSPSMNSLANDVAFRKLWEVLGISQDYIDLMSLEGFLTTATTKIVPPELVLKMATFARGPKVELSQALHTTKVLPELSKKGFTARLNVANCPHQGQLNQAWTALAISFYEFARDILALTAAMKTGGATQSIVDEYLDPKFAYRVKALPSYLRMTQETSQGLPSSTAYASQAITRMILSCKIACHSDDSLVTAPNTGGLSSVIASLIDRRGKLAALVSSDKKSNTGILQYLVGYILDGSRLDMGIQRQTPKQTVTAGGPGPAMQTMSGAVAGIPLIPALTHTILGSIKTQQAYGLMTLGGSTGPKRYRSKALEKAALENGWTQDEVDDAIDAFWLWPSGLGVRPTTPLDNIVMVWDVVSTTRLIQRLGTTREKPGDRLLASMYHNMLAENFTVEATVQGVPKIGTLGCKPPSGLRPSAGTQVFGTLADVTHQLVRNFDPSGSDFRPSAAIRFLESLMQAENKMPKLNPSQVIKSAGPRKLFQHKTKGDVGLHDVLLGVTAQVEGGRQVLKEALEEYRDACVPPFSSTEGFLLAASELHKAEIVSMPAHDDFKTTVVRPPAILSARTNGASRSALKEAADAVVSRHPPGYVPEANKRQLHQIARAYNIPIDDNVPPGERMVNARNLYKILEGIKGKSRPVEGLATNKGGADIRWLTLSLGWELDRIIRRLAGTTTVATEVSRTRLRGAPGLQNLIPLIKRMFSHWHSLSYYPPTEISDIPDLMWSDCTMRGFWMALRKAVSKSPTAQAALDGVATATNQDFDGAGMPPTVSLVIGYLLDREDLVFHYVQRLSTRFDWVGTKRGYMNFGAPGDHWVVKTPNGNEGLVKVQVHAGYLRGSLLRRTRVTVFIGQTATDIFIYDASIRGREAEILERADFGQMEEVYPNQSFLGGLAARVRLLVPGRYSGDPAEDIARYAAKQGYGQPRDLSPPELDNIDQGIFRGNGALNLYHARRWRGPSDSRTIPVPGGSGRLSFFEKHKTVMEYRADGVSFTFSVSALLGDLSPSTDPIIIEAASALKTHNQELMRIVGSGDRIGDLAEALRQGFNPQAPLVLAAGLQNTGTRKDSRSLPWVPIPGGTHLARPAPMYAREEPDLDDIITMARRKIRPTKLEGAIEKARGGIVGELAPVFTDTDAILEAMLATDGVADTSPWFEGFRQAMAEYTSIADCGVGFGPLGFDDGSWAEAAAEVAQTLVRLSDLGKEGHLSPPARSVAMGIMVLSMLWSGPGQRADPLPPPRQPLAFIKAEISAYAPDSVDPIVSFDRITPQLAIRRGFRPPPAGAMGRLMFPPHKYRVSEDQSWTILPQGGDDDLPEIETLVVYPDMYVEPTDGHAYLYYSERVPGEIPNVYAVGGLRLRDGKAYLPVGGVLTFIRDLSRAIRSPKNIILTLGDSEERVIGCTSWAFLGDEYVQLQSDGALARGTEVGEPAGYTTVDEETGEPFKAPTPGSRTGQTIRVYNSITLAQDLTNLLHPGARYRVVAVLTYIPHNGDNSRSEDYSLADM